MIKSRSQLSVIGTVTEWQDVSKIKENISIFTYRIIAYIWKMQLPFLFLPVQLIQYNK